MVTSFSVWNCRHRLGGHAASAAAADADVGGAAARHWRYSSSVISIAPLGVAVERGEDTVVDESHDGEEGGGVEDNNDDKHHREAVLSSLLLSMRCRWRWCRRLYCRCLSPLLFPLQLMFQSSPF